MSRDLQRRIRSSAGPAALFALVVVLLFLAVYVLPPHLADRDLGGAEVPPKDLASARNSVRSTLLQALGGAFFIATALFTWRQLRISQRQLRVSEDEQTASRFTKAVEQLGGSTLDMKLGGIYSLERLAYDSARDHGPVVEVLSAYVREHAPWPPPSGGVTPKEQVPEPDVQAALTVLGRRRIEHEEDRPERINLCRVDLRGADLRDANFSHVLLNGAHLEGADLRKATLRETRLVEAHLNDVRGRKVVLAEAKLIQAHLDGAQLFGADLRGAKLMDAWLQGARLAEAKLQGAEVHRAHLEGAYLGTAETEGILGLDTAFSDDATTWPKSAAPT